jgi:hypothetical protein
MMWGLAGSWFFMHFYYNVEDSVVLVGLNCSFCYIIVGLNLVLIVLACGLVSWIWIVTRRRLKFRDVNLEVDWEFLAMYNED